MWLQVPGSKNFLQSILLKSEDKTYNNKKIQRKGGEGVSVHPSGLVGMQFDICCSKIAVCAVLTYIGSLPNQLECLSVHQVLF